MSRFKVIWRRPGIGERTGWARTCIALAGGKGARAIVGEYLIEGEQLLDADTLVIQVEPSGAAHRGVEIATIWRVFQAHADKLKPTAPKTFHLDGQLVQATAAVYNWHTEHVSLREKLAELLAADRDGAHIGDGTEHEREYLTELERCRHYLKRAYQALDEVDNCSQLDLDTRLGDIISGPLKAIKQAYPGLE